MELRTIIDGIISLALIYVILRLGENRKKIEENKRRISRENDDFPPL